MGNDYFAALRVPGVPGTSPATGDGGNPHKHSVSPVSPVSPVKNTDAENCTGPAAPCPTCASRHFWHDGSAWRCEGCNPPAADASRFVTVSGGKAAPMPPPALPWPPELSVALRRVSTVFEWSDQDRRDFVAWARRSKEGLADAAAFLEAEAAKLPAPGLDDRRRTVLDRLAADPGARVAWLCTDDGQSDPVLLTIAIRGKGSVWLAIPRAKFNALALPQLIEEFAAQAAE